MELAQMILWVCEILSSFCEHVMEIGILRRSLRSQSGSKVNAWKRLLKSFMGRLAESLLEFLLA